MKPPPVCAKFWGWSNQKKAQDGLSKCQAVGLLQGGFLQRLIVPNPDAVNAFKPAKHFTQRRIQKIFFDGVVELPKIEPLQKHALVIRISLN